MGIEAADELLKREKMSRLEILSKYLEEKPCLCNGILSLSLAKETLSNNQITEADFDSAVINLLDNAKKVTTLS